jgi:hypothetical protein
LNSSETFLIFHQQNNGKEFFKSEVMEKIKFVYWQDENMWIGYLEDYPDYRTQGESLEELKENLKDIQLE